MGASETSSSTLEKALLALKEARKKLEAVERTKYEPIAIIGIGCRFPGGATDPSAFWQLLHTGIDAIREIPPDRWDIEQYYDPNPDAPGKMYTRYGGFLDSIDQFDPQFFGISPREAISMDPQQRLLLEVCWEALENAGHLSERLSRSRTGVFIGMTQNDYARRRLFSGDPNTINVYDGTGNGFCLASGRVAYVLGLQGPNLVLDTGCSSSLVTTHLACQGLRSGECDLALAGGVQLMSSPEATISLSKTRALSPDGRCKTFDASADGFGRGEGCGVLVLKRLSDALQSGDHIVAVIRGSAVNHDGPSSGLTVPNGQSQQAVIRQALKNARVKPEQISYIETHGTGTSLGDPIEVQALGEVLQEGHSLEDPVIIGSVKTNIGHLEAAAGVAGVIKVALALQHQEIPVHLHFKTPNPHIPWHELPVTIPTTATCWKPKDTPRIASVSSFGLGGTNAHVIVEEAPQSNAQMSASQLGIDRPIHLFTLSAKTQNALQKLSECYVQHLADHQEDSVADICFTVNTGRAHFQNRLAISAASTDELRQKLSSNKGVLHGTASEEQPKIAFLFTGQGSQYVGMGRQLYDTLPIFRQTIDRCAEILNSYLDISLLDVLYPNHSQSQIPDLTSQINMTAYTQPALFAVEYALFQVWKSWGITPSYFLGHSIGEYAAACAAGIFTPEDGLKLVAHRGRLMQSLPPDGKMVAVLAEETVVEDAIRPYTDDVSIAAINGNTSVVISGIAHKIDDIAATLHDAGITTKPLQVSHAFHSPQMDPILEEFSQVAMKIDYAAPTVAIVCDTTGQLQPAALQDPQYWRDHIRQPVRFLQSMQTLYQQGCNVFVEIGPHPILSGLGCQIPAPTTTTWLPSLRRKHEDWQQLFQSLGELYVRGIAIDWTGVDQDYARKRGYARKRIPLPTYPFERSRYWAETKTQPSSGVGQTDIAAPQADFAELLPPDTLDTLVQHLQAQSGLTDAEKQLLPKLLPKLIPHFQREQQELFPDTVVAAQPPPSLLQDLKQAEPEQRQPLLFTYIHEQVAAVLELDLSEIDPNQSLHSVGFDSLMAIDLKNRLQDALQLDIPIMNFIAEPTVSALTRQLLDLLDISEESSANKTFAPEASDQGKDLSLSQASASSVTPEQAEELLKNLDQLDDQEVERLLTILAKKEGES